MLYSWNGIGVGASIETLQGNQELNEYERESTGNHCEAILECVEGEGSHDALLFSFQIRMRYQGRMRARSDMDVRAWVDGREIRGGHWRSNRRHMVLRSMRVKQGDGLYEGDLSFAPLMKTDDEALVDVKGAALRRLGTIKIEVQQGLIEYQHQDPTRRARTIRPRGVAANVGYVSETQHKLGCAVEATNLRPVSQTGAGGGQNGHWRFFPDSHHPTVCTFTFRYHTQTKLIILGVIPDPTAVKPDGSDSDRSESPQIRTPPNTAVTQDVTIGVKRELLVDVGEEDGDGIELVKRIKVEDRGLGSLYRPIEVPDIATRRRSARFILPLSGIIDLTDDD